ncbi:hypothetical protein CKG00_10830 [Morganella morganii]|uniref:DUF4224 domain-containing protein n=1 Tax=Morganella morganii TaxID=582 RepID=A0A433ZXJ0_MORMO|nr:DUF4224 domain-containing protein [Morganella morganii]RUT66825.1 hypothetical protein CKG00_10830 [Morganella morganii]
MSEPLYLTDDELITLTGFKIKSCQVKWLRENHIHHYINKLGKPIVIRSKFTGQYYQQADIEAETPDFGALTDG